MRYELCSAAVIRDLLGGEMPKKRYGQNFLIDRRVPERIAEAVASDGAPVLEIGPGIGCMTAELAQRAPAVTAVEIDRSLIPVLEKTLEDFDNAEVVCADFMKLPLREFMAERFGSERSAACGNLPYYITSPIVMKLLEEAADLISSLTIMVQAEVAARFCAAPGTPDYGAITAVIAYYGKCEKLFNVPRGAFWPVPGVDSAVARITLGAGPTVAVKDRAHLMRTIAAVFGQRRKTLVNAAAAPLGVDKATLADIVASLGFSADVRGERLGIADFARLSDAVLSARGG